MSHVSIRQHTSADVSCNSQTKMFYCSSHWPVLEFLAQCVAKIFKKNAMRTESYFDEALTQMAAECFAQQFNRSHINFAAAQACLSHLPSSYFEESMCVCVCVVCVY